MLQEIITYLLVASAIILAALKIVARFRKKKPGKFDFSKAKLPSEHNCSNCSEECTLRQTPYVFSEKNPEACHTDKAP